ncbi:MAG: 2-dehydropantoate 2-reductase [Spirochaetales bacterium]|nr:2-dehydropantoate 2-reductase [Spirochaetales bacterium]
MNVLIYGGGAVGLGIASCLLKSNVSVDIIAREKTVKQLALKGLIRDGIFGQVTIPPEKFGAFTNLTFINKNKSYDYICVCVKSFDSLSVAMDISKHKELLGYNTPIILFQNGWGNTEKFCRYFPETQIYNARVITGFTRPNLNQVTITVHADDVHMGSLFYPFSSGKMKQLCTAISNGDLPCSLSSAIGKDLWAKMLYNCPLNPLGAILGIPYGRLSENLYTREIMNKIIHETFAVMIASGYSTHWESPEDFIEVFYSRLVPRTYEHESSTLQDLRAGKKTEIDALNGEVIRLGEKHGIPVNVNRVMWGLIKYREII